MALSQVTGPTPAAAFARSTPVLSRIRQALTWRRVGVVLLLCAVLSTQLFAQPNLFDRWSMQRIAEGWVDLFLELAAAGFAMLVGFALAEGAVQSHGLRRAIAILVAVPAGAALGNWLALELLQPEGFIPSSLQFAGETVRLAAFGCVIAFIYMFRRRAEHLAREMHDTEVARQELVNQTAQAQLQLMEAQIEPHFLFNSLANVQRLFETEPESGERVLEHLKTYLRAALPQMRGSNSTLAAEAELARAYLEVLAARMRERLRFAIDVPAELAKCAFPPMMLITLVENAIKHGIHPAFGGGTVRVHARREGSRLIVAVADTGVGFRGRLGSGVGLANIRARLQVLFGERAELDLEANEPSGVIASIAVPLT